MNIILLSGGSGKRLWPLSNDVRSKQFLKILRSPGGGYESMVQRVARQIRSADPDAEVTVATSKSQVSSLRNQLGGGISLSVEPCRRDTFPAIALATAYLRDKRGVPEDSVAVVCPVDPYVEDAYFAALRDLGALAETSGANLVLMGITPTYPSEKYGYILPETEDTVSRVSEFKEKPSAVAAKEYISRGALWNGGVFAYRLRYVLGKAEELLGCSGYDELLERYGSLPKISFDYAVVEKEPSIRVMRFCGAWKDLGTWNTLTEAMEDPVIGDGIQSACENTHIVNELDIPVLATGLRDCVISAGPQGVLVADKDQSSYIKPLVDRITDRVMFAEKSWGSYRVIHVEPESLTVRVELAAGSSMSYHSHSNRDEVWTVISGEGETVLDGVTTPVRAGDVVKIPREAKHTVRATSPLKIIEVQLGEDIRAEDKRKYPFPE